tara:strand:+ start:32 stop:1279 length:1248 start_codon:yes stop_codon:yes gene_type:complete
MATSLSPNLDEILRLGAMSAQYENQEMGLANAFRGMVGLRPASGVGSNFGANLRASLGIQQKEIEDTLAARMAQQDYKDKKDYRNRWVELGFDNEYDNIYEVIFERVYPKQLSREKSRLDIAGTKTKRSEHDRAEYLIDLIHQWKRRNPDNPLRGIVSTVIQQEGFSGYDVEHFNKLGKQMWPELWGQTKKDVVALEKAEVDLAAAKGTPYAKGEVERDKIADRYEPSAIPDYQNMTIPEQQKLLSRAKEELIAALTGLNISTSQRDQLQDELVDRLSHLEGRKDMSTKEKFIRDLYYLVDESGKSKRRKRLDRNIAKRLLIEKYKFDPEMMALSPAWAEMAEEIAEGAIEGMRYEMGRESAIVRISGSGKHKEDRLIINRVPTKKEAAVLLDEGVIFLITIDGEPLTLRDTREE